MGFQKAVKQKAKLRVALAGVSGSGKTYSALVMAKALGKKVALIDSERSSALLYADLFEFDHLDLSNHAIGSYKKAISEAAAAGYDVLIIDSLSHEWAGRGGALEAVDRQMAANAGNKFTAWNGVSQQHQGLLDDILTFPGHVIATMRKKTEYVLETNEKGKQVPRKVGLAPVQRDGIEYEFTALLSLELGGGVLVEKTRCPALEEMGGALRREEMPKVGETLRSWLAAGVDAPPTPPAEVTHFEKAETDPLRREVGLLIATAKSARTPAEVDALRKRFDALPAAEQAEVLPVLKECKAALQKAGVTA